MPRKGEGPQSWVLRRVIMTKVQLRCTLALLALVIVTSACADRPESPTRPSPVVPTRNLVSVVWSSPSGRADKGSPLSVMVRYELTQVLDLSAVPRLDANGTATEARSTATQRVGPGFGEVRLDGATVLLTSAAEKTEFIELVLISPKHLTVEKVLAPWPIHWYWPTGVATVGSGSH